jgi:hypothetical protein
MDADRLAHETAGDRRRFRVPYEWILGAMFVGTFCISAWMDSWIIRGVWLALVMPLACTSLRVRRDPEEPARGFGVLIPAAAIGWLYVATVYVVVEYKHREGMYEVSEFLAWLWPIPPLLSLSCLVLAAARRGRYREFGVFANAALLLVFAWWVDRVFSPVS